MIKVCRGLRRSNNSHRLIESDMMYIGQVAVDTAISGLMFWKLISCRSSFLADGALLPGIHVFPRDPPHCFRRFEN